MARKPTDQKGIQLRAAIRDAKASGDSGAFRKAQDAYASYRGRPTGPQTGGALRNINPKNAKSLIRAQQEENANIAQQNNVANNPNISGIGGGRTVTYDENGQPTVNVTMGDAEKSAYDKFLQMAQAPVDFSSLPSLTNDFSADRQRIEDELYAAQQRRLDKEFGAAEEDFARKMSNQGIVPGSELYNKLRSKFDEEKTGAYRGAREGAMQMAGAEQQRMFGNQMASRQQGFTEMDYSRTNPMNMFGGLMGLGANMTSAFGNFQGSQRAPTDIAGIALGVEGMRKAGSGGPMSLADYQARLNADTQQRKDLMQFGADLEKQNQPKQPGFSSALGSLGGNLAGSFLGGLGQSAGASLGAGWFK